jgi:NAD(P)H-flavin reductase
MKKFVAKFEDRIELTEKVFRYTFEYVKPHLLDIKAGQGVKLIFDGNRTEFIPICHQSSINHGFEIFYSKHEGDNFDLVLSKLKFGDTIEGLHVDSSFDMRLLKSNKGIYLFAYNHEIGAIRSIILTLLRDDQYQQPIIFFWQASDVSEYYELHDFMDLSDHYENFYFFPVVQKAPAEWTLVKGPLVDFLEKQKLNVDYSVLIEAEKDRAIEIQGILKKFNLQSEKMQMINY